MSRILKPKTPWSSRCFKESYVVQDCDGRTVLAVPFKPPDEKPRGKGLSAALNREEAELLAGMIARMPYIEGPLRRDDADS